MENNKFKYIANKSDWEVLDLLKERVELGPDTMVSKQEESICISAHYFTQRELNILMKDIFALCPLMVVGAQIGHINVVELIFDISPWKEVEWPFDDDEDVIE